MFHDFPWQATNNSKVQPSRREKPRGRHHGLTAQKKQEIKEAFELFDTDGSGMVVL